MHSHAQSPYKSAVNKAAQEKYENFRQMVEATTQPPQEMIEKGMKIRSSLQKALIDEAMAQNYGSQYLYVERWMPRSAWLDLSEEERQEYFSNMEGIIQQLKSDGIQVLGFAINGYETRGRSDYQYVSVWQMPSKSHVDMLEESVSQAGWHNYFELINTHGQVMPPPALQEDIVGLK